MSFKYMLEYEWLIEGFLSSYVGLIEKLKDGMRNGFEITCIVYEEIAIVLVLFFI
jgi:hypothetical protein